MQKQIDIVLLITAKIYLLASPSWFETKFTALKLSCWFSFCRFVDEYMWLTLRSGQSALEALKFNKQQVWKTKPQKQGP